MENQVNLNKLISEYNGHNSFMNSLKSQLMIRGSLSPKQMECAGRFFNVSGSSEVVSVAATLPKTYSFAKGDKVMVRKWFANNKAKELGLKVFFRGLIIEEVLNETSKAVLVSVSFNSKLSTYCHCCGLNLDTEISKATGVGAVCAKKYLGIKRVTLADAPAILAKIEEECKIAGIIKSIWIPKSQMVSKAEQILFDKE
jgi:hypothetical protein